jgi:hypothetical protein
MKAGDESFERLRAAVERIAIVDAEEMLREARAEARARVRSLLTDALAHAMLEQAHGQLRDPKPASGSAGGGEEAWYVYGVIAGEDAGAIEPVESIEVLCEGALAAAVDRVPLEDFGEHQLRSHLADMDWVERTARAHEQKLDAIRQRSTVIPMRMCTVYRSESGVREMLRRESSALSETLSRLRGKTEWGVKVMLGPARQPDHRSSGTAYMRGRREQLDHDHEITARVQDATDRIHERLRTLASDGVLVPLQRPEVSGRSVEMVMSGAYLVADAQQQRFSDQVRALGAHFGSLGLTLELTGPWPAYNFVGAAIGVTL